MRTEVLQQELTKAGWKRVAPARYLERDFDLVGTRWFTFTKWRVLVKTLPVFNSATAAEWIQTYYAISRASKSLIWGRCFLLCLVADEVEEAAASQLVSDSFGFYGVLRFKGGGGIILAADEKSGAVYGRVPTLPYDVHKYSKSVKAILGRLVNAGVEGK